MTDHTQREIPLTAEQIEQIFYGPWIAGASEDDCSTLQITEAEATKLKPQALAAIYLRDELAAYEQASAELPEAPKVLRTGFEQIELKSWKDYAKTLRASAVKQIVNLKALLAAAERSISMLRTTIPPGLNSGMSEKVLDEAIDFARKGEQK